MHCYTIRAAKAALQIFTLSNSFLSKFDEWFCNDWYWIDLGNYFDGQWRTQNERKWQQLIYYQCNKGLNNGAARTNKLASLEAVQVRSCNLTAQWHRRGKWRATSAAKNGDDSVIWTSVKWSKESNCWAHAFSMLLLSCRPTTSKILQSHKLTWL